MTALTPPTAETHLLSATAAARPAGRSFTPPSTTAPGWPSPRSTPTEKADTCAGFLDRTLAFFAGCSINARARRWSLGPRPPFGGYRDCGGSLAHGVTGDPRGMTQVIHRVALDAAGPFGAHRSAPLRERPHQLTNAQMAASGAIKFDGMDEPTGIPPAHSCSVSAAWTHLPGDPLTLGHRDPAPRGRPLPAVALPVQPRRTPRVNTRLAAPRTPSPLNRAGAPALQSLDEPARPAPRTTCEPS